MPSSGHCAASVKNRQSYRHYLMAVTKLPKIILEHVLRN